MGINLQLPGLTELRPRITVVGVGGAGGNAVNNMIESGLEGVEFVAANTDAQALAMSGAGTRIQMGVGITEGLGAGSRPEIGAAAAEEAIDEIRSHLDGVHMLFITAGMGGGTGTGAAPVIARTAKELGILTVGVVTKPFEFEGQRRMRIAQEGIAALAKHVDTIIVIPNQNLFRIASEKTTFADAFMRADEVLKAGVSCITDLMVKEGLINLDFADVRTVMQNMGTALMGTGEAEGEKRALQAAEAAISNPLLGEISMRGAKGLLVSITGSFDMTLYEVEEAASRIRREVDPDQNPDVNIIVGATFETSLQGRIRVSVVATGIQPGPDLAGISGPPLVEPKGRDQRLTDRLSKAGPPPADQRHRNGDGGGGRAQMPAGDGSERRVLIEPKARAPQDSHYGSTLPGERHVTFEPLPPSRTMRPPRRPLTAHDFPELAGASNGGRPDTGGNSAPRSIRRGFLDWMAGRNRSSARGDSPVLADRPVAGAPLSAKEDRTTSRKLPEAGDQHRAHTGYHPDGSGGEDGVPLPRQVDRRGGRGSDELFEIPEFFKKT
jgi:cell division protein FtsZ